VDAYASLLRLHEAAARRLAHVVCGSGIDADDVAQDAFVKAWSSLVTFRDGAPFRPWLLRIVANEARNRRRSAGRRAGYELRCAEDRAGGATSPPGGIAASADVAVLASDRRRVLVAALAKLPTAQREVVTCRYLVGLDEVETATVLGLPRGTVKSRAARGLARLRGLLPESGGDGDV
jgi:RNA polymerase sigma factor (sigma-70 family)